MAKILTIDNDQYTRFLLKEMLCDSSYDVEEAASGDAALQKLRQNPADLVITEMVLREMDGVEIIFALRREFPNTKIIAMSGGGIIAAANYLRLARSLKVSHVVAKPFSTEEMLGAVQAALSPADSH